MGVLTTAVSGILAAYLHLSAPAAGSASASAAVVAPAPERASLKLLRAKPTAWLGRSARFSIQFRASLPEWDPLLTELGPRTHAAYSAWADESFLWEPAAWGNASERLFARRDSAVERRLKHAVDYERFEVVGTVVAVLAGEPWIELTSVRRLPLKLEEGALLHASRAVQLMSSGLWDLASADLERAVVGPMPAAAKAELERLAADCARRRDQGRARRRS